MKSAQIISNGEKARTGQEVKEKVSQLLEALLNDGLILTYESDVNHSHRDYSYGKQFKCDFVVETIDSKFILIRASNSFRSDRAKIPFYDFLGIQQYSEFAGDIVASILLFPDGEEENTTFVSTRKKVQEGEFFSPATHWLTFSEINEFFNNYCSEVEALFDEDGDSETPLELISDDQTYLYQRSFSNVSLQLEGEAGSYYGKSGNRFEKFLVEELNSHENLASYRAGGNACLEFDVIMNSILSFFSLDINKVLSLEATDTITKLKNGGSPKTDIHLKVFISRSENYEANISVKNTTSSRVSCHDYQAKDFARVVAPDDDNFKLLVETFQQAGSWRGYDELVKNKNLDLDTDELLVKYMPKLIEWAITGAHDEESTLNPKTQIANFLLTRDANNNACKMQSCEDYMRELHGNIGNGRGAPFSWTYPSKRRGSRIQLKMPISLPQA